MVSVMGRQTHGHQLETIIPCHYRVAGIKITGQSTNFWNKSHITDFHFQMKKKSAVSKSEISFALVARNITIITCKYSDSLICLFDLGLTSLSTFFSHIATVSGCGRELNAHF